MRIYNTAFAVGAIWLVWSCCSSVLLASTAFVVPTKSRKTTQQPRPYLLMVREESSSSWEERWNNKYQQLVEYQENLGHTFIKFEDDMKLANWIRIQKENLRRGVMRQDRIEKLAKLGWIVAPTKNNQDVLTTADQEKSMMSSNVNVAIHISKMIDRSLSWEERWNYMYKKLYEFQSLKGHTRVRFHNREGHDRKLADWVLIQRENLRRGRIRNDRLSKLQAIDFA